MVYIFKHHILCAPAYIPTMHTNTYKPTNLHITNPTNAPIPYIPYPYPCIPTLHTFSAPTNPQIPAYLPYPYIPTLLLQPLHPTLPASPIITQMLHEQAARWCCCVLPVMGYYVLRNLLSKLLHLNLVSLLRASCKRKGCWIPTKICISGRLYNHYDCHCGPKSPLLPWWHVLQMWACLYVSLCSSMRPIPTFNMSISRHTM